MTDSHGRGDRVLGHRPNLIAACLATFIASVALPLFFANTTSAKEAVAYFGAESQSGSLGGEFKVPGDIAVNGSGAGPAAQGDIYVVDRGNYRIQRFAQDDNGTPADPYDDTYPFVSAWGTDVDRATAGGNDYEICTVAADCQAGRSSGGNGALGQVPPPAPAVPPGGPAGIAVDPDTGHVYLADRGNYRVNVYAGDGTFLRSFGFDVVASGPGDTGTGFEICVAVSGDVCKEGTAGSGTGQFGFNDFSAVLTFKIGIAISPDANPETGSVYVADPINKRINVYDLDGSSPSTIGSAADFGSEGPYDLAVDSRGILYAEGGNQADDWKIARYDSSNANGVGVGFLSSISIPPLLTAGGSQLNGGLAVALDPDGAGPATDILYALRGTSKGVVQQFGPLNAPGLTAPPTAADGEHGGVAGFFYPSGLGFDQSSGRLFVGSQYHIEVEKDQERHGVYVLDVAGGPPSGSLDSLTKVTATSVTLHGTIEPNGLPPTSYRVEYSSDGVEWQSTPATMLDGQDGPQAIETTLAPPPGGLQPSTSYQVRLAISKPFTPPVTTSALSFTTLAAPPEVETVGAPVRSATTAQLNGRVNPRNKVTTFHFEYGSQGPCGVDSCDSTKPVTVESGGVHRLVSAELTGLKPNTIYHYRLVADNGPGSPIFGDDMTARTRASDAPLSHGDFPGAPGSDRAYEMVSLPDSGGNPVNSDATIQSSGQGDRAVYSISGGTPISGTGTLASFYFAERNASGWATRNITPGRNELVGSNWSSIGTGPDDLSALSIRNMNDAGVLQTIWRLTPFGAPVRVFDVAPPTTLGTPGAALTQVFLTASKSSRVIVGLHLSGVKSSPMWLYEVASGVPEMVGFLPGETAPKCDSTQRVAETARLSSDGRYLVFISRGTDLCGDQVPSRIYMRDLELNESKLVSPPPLSGQDCGSLRTLRLTTDELFFWTPDRLVTEDTPAASCADFRGPDGDIYRYDLDASTLECVTCPLVSFDVDVEASLQDGGGTNQIAVSGDGSRIYFRSVSSTPLVVGAAAGSESTYVLETQTGQLRWVGTGIAFGQGDPMTSDGSVVLFRSSSAALNPVGGTSHNGGNSQLYRYDDNDRSLICVSCPRDGAQASGPVLTVAGPSADGKTIGFTTSEALLSGDQNTPPAGQSPSRGTDVYEWRDGRLFLITDGLTDWASFSEPRAMGISPSGRDLYFTAFAQYTPDALDAYNRLYDARIGGGFEYPEPPVPCPLEVCQGTPKGAPEEAPPASKAITGPGNRPSPATKARCPKGKRLVRRAGKARCVKRRPAKKGNRKANRDRRTGR